MIRIRHGEEVGDDVRSQAIKLLDGTPTRARVVVAFEELAGYLGRRYENTPVQDRPDARAEARGIVTDALRQLGYKHCLDYVPTN